MPELTLAKYLWKQEDGHISFFSFHITMFFHLGQPIGSLYALTY